MKTYDLTAQSINDRREYAATIEADTEREAEEIFHNVVTDHCRAEFDSAPIGIPFLIDPRTVTVRESQL